MINWGLVGCALGIYFCYSLYGLVQERILTTPFFENADDTTPVFFKETLFLLLFQTLTNALAAFLAIRFVTKAKATVPVMRFAPVSLFYIGAMFCSNMSLQYIDYPTQVLGKSCKPLAVLFIGVLFGRVFTRAKYVSVLLITLGISMFMLQKIKHKTSDGDVLVDDSMRVWIGRLLLLGSLTCDGVTGALQDKLVGHSRPSAYHLMLYNNLWAALYLFVALLVSGRLLPGALFIWQYPAILSLMCVFALTSASGQIFIYYAVRHHGSLVCTMITTTRKFFTILLSVLWFGHILSVVQWLAVGVVFAGLALDIYFSAKHKKQQTLKSK